MSAPIAFDGVAAIYCHGCGQRACDSLSEEERWVDVPPSSPGKGWGRRREVRQVLTVWCTPCRTPEFTKSTEWRRA